MAPKYRVHDDGVAKARQMIDSNQYDLETEWDDAAPSTEQSNDKIDRDGYDGYDGYGEWHLAVNTEASQATSIQPATRSSPLTTWSRPSTPASTRRPRPYGQSASACVRPRR